VTATVRCRAMTAIVGDRRGRRRSKRTPPPRSALLHAVPLPGTPHHRAVSAPARSCPELDAQIKATDDPSGAVKAAGPAGHPEMSARQIARGSTARRRGHVRRLATPANIHGYVSPPFDHPCTAWPAKRRAPQESPRHVRRDGQAQRSSKATRYRRHRARASGHHPVTVTDSRSRTTPPNLPAQYPTTKSAEVERTDGSCGPRDTWRRSRCCLCQFRVLVGADCSLPTVWKSSRRSQSLKPSGEVCEIVDRAPRPCAPTR